MSYLDMITFEESTLLEGEQAEAYKKRKAEEKEKNHDPEDREIYAKDSKYNQNRRNAGDQATTKHMSNYLKTADKDWDRKLKSIKTVDKEIARRYDEGSPSVDAWNKKYNNMADGKETPRDFEKSRDEALKYYNQHKNIASHRISAEDATNRHMRRHPKQYKEAVELAESLLESYQADCIYC